MHALVFLAFGFALISALSAIRVFGMSINEQHVSISVIQALVERMDGMEAREAEYKLEINGLKRELARQKDEIEDLQNKLNGHDRLLLKLIRRVQPRSMSPGSGPPAVMSNSSSDRTRDVKLDIPINNAAFRIRRADNQVTVAFTAGLTHTVFHNGPHQNIIFDRVETNVGNGYNQHHGVFIAPVSGLYLFYSSIFSDFNGAVWCQIVVNGLNKASIHAHGTDGGQDHGSQAIIVELQRGDDVAVQNLISDATIFGHTDIYSTFSGVLLQQGSSQSGSIVG